jgi:hypothetical protein
MSNRSVRGTNSLSSGSAQNSGAILAAVVIVNHPEGQPDQLVFVPVCAGCGGPILDFDEANLVLEDHEPDEPGAFGEPFMIDGLRVLPVHGTLRAYHWPCDSGEVPWVRLSTVLREDQRTLRSLVSVGDERDRD